MITMITCACGCGEKTPSVDSRGRPRKVIQGHQKRKRRRVIEIIGDTAVIELTKGKFAIIDFGDLHLVDKWNWQANESRPGSGLWYAIRHREKGKSHIRMHREIMSAKDSDPLIDHKDGDGLNNRRSNLRWCTQSQNCANRRHGNPKSGFRGVSYNSRVKRWASVIYVKGKRIRLGHFRELMDAAKAYNNSAVKYFGTFAKLNKIEGEELT